MTSLTVPKLDFQEGNWKYDPKPRHSSMPIIATTKRSSVIYEIDLCPEKDIVYFINNSHTDVEYYEGFILERGLDLIQIKDRIFSRLDRSKREQLGEELDQIGELERKLKKEFGGYRAG